MPLLDWVNRQQAEQSVDHVPYHLLQFQQAYGDEQQAQENLVIQGDNLLALKALLPRYGGEVKCIFIDPPYNTQSAFEHYDDKLEHAQWLSMMYPRLQLLKDLLAEDGSIWITLDDHEAHYLKVLCDEIFGRKNFIANVAWHKRVSPANDSKYFSADFDHILIYAKQKDLWQPNRLARNKEQLANYKNPDQDARGEWNSSAYTCAKSAVERPNLYYAIIQPNTGEEIWPNTTRVWAYSQETHQQNVHENLIYWGKDGLSKMPRIKKFLTETKLVVPRSIWGFDEAGHNQESKIEIDKLFPNESFSTPKPERLLNKIIEIASKPTDLILDSFLGSGTTAAVAHKMGRRYIGIEMGEHAKTHVLPRLKKVIEGEQGGISKITNWQGGGGFSFYTLGNPVFDQQGFLNPDVRFNDLASYIWWLKTKTALSLPDGHATPFLGIHQNTAYYLLYNGILGDRRPNGGNVLTTSVLSLLNQIHPYQGKRIIIGEATRIGDARLAALNIEFMQIPYALYGNADPSSNRQ